MNNSLEVKNLCKKYSEFELKNINLKLPKGMIMGLIGENGAGKTTTIKSILNLINIDNGEIKIFGLNIKENEKKIKEDIGVVLDDAFFSEYLNPADINKIMRKIYENWDEKLYYKYLEDFKLPKNKISKEFSSGMKMKLKIAVALSHHPKLLILDEPTSPLDPVARSEILDIFQDFIQNEENSIFVSSHITSDLEHIADYITFINNGEIVLSKTRYVFIISSTIIGAIVGIIASFLIVFIIDKQIPSLYDYINIALGGILGVGLIEAIQIPCVYKWGAEKGRIQMFIVAAIIILLVGGIFFVGQKSNINFPVNNMLKIVLNFLPAILILTTIIIYYVSYRVSYRIYKNKEE